MKFIEPHIHMESRSYDEMMELSMKGVVAVVSPAYALLPTYDAPTILNTIDYMVRTVKLTYDRFFINLFLGVGLNWFGIPKDYERVLERFPKFIENHKEVVAISEVGLDPRDPKRLGFVAETAVKTDLKVQIEILKEEMKIAKKYSIPIDCHTPPRSDDPPIKRVEYAEKFLALADEVGLPRDLLIVDHADEEIVKFVSGSGAYVAVTIRPQGMSPEDAVKIIGKYGADKILVNSDADGQPWQSCVLAVPDTAFAMRRYGLSEAVIKKVTFDNPLDLFKLKL